METTGFISQRIETGFPSEIGWTSGLTMVFLLSGTLHLQINAKIYALQPNDFLFFKPYELFCSLTPAESYKAYVITVESELLKQLCPNWDQFEFDLRILRANNELPVYNAICSSLAQAAYQAFKKTPVASTRITAHVCDLLTALIENFGEQYSSEESLPQGSQSRLRVAAILRYISEHYADQISLPEISAQFGLHPQYFSAYFKKQFGSTFSEHLNNYRISKSLPALLAGKSTILDIALANGFNNHKTYGLAFRKMLGCSPREYRALNQPKQRSTLETFEDIGNDFRFLLRFWNPDTATIDQPSSLRTNVTITLHRDRQVYPVNRTKHFITVGRAIFCQRSDVQKQLRQAKQDLALDYVRIQDIFSDSLFVYYEDDAKNPVFNWNALDEVFDFLLSIGIKPYPELGYMPTQMASKKQYAGWHYQPNVSFPKSLNHWQTLITRFFEHLIHRYGAQEVRSWLFDFWTLPNMLLEDSYWYESKEKFFQFYEATYRAMKKVDSQLQLATPNFSYPAGMVWYQDFLRFARMRGLEPAFVSARLYSYPDGQQNEKAEYLRYNPHGKGKQKVSIPPDRSLPTRAVQELQALIAESGFPKLDIILSDWNVTFFPADYTRDTCFMGPYILNTYFQLYPYVDGISYTSLSDINEDFFNSDLLFHGGPGLLDHYGVPKASYHALSIAYRLNKNIIQTGPNYVTTQTEKGYEVLLYNLDFYNQNYRSMDTSSLSYSQRYTVFEGVHTLNCHMVFPVESGSYSITKHKVNRDSGSSYDMWIKMGSPAELSRELVQHLQSRCAPDIYCESMTVTDTLRFDEVVPPHGFVYISIQRQ